MAGSSADDAMLESTGTAAGAGLGQLKGEHFRRFRAGRWSSATGGSVRPSMDLRRRHASPGLVLLTRHVRERSTMDRRRTWRERNAPGAATRTRAATPLPGWLFGFSLCRLLQDAAASAPQDADDGVRRAVSSSSKSASTASAEPRPAGQRRAPGPRRTMTPSVGTRTPSGSAKVRVTGCPVSVAVKTIGRAEPGGRVDVSPGVQRREHRYQIAARGRQHILVTLPLAGLAVGPTFQHAVLDQRCEPVCQDVGRYAQPCPELGEPGPAADRLPDHQDGPALTDHLEGAGDRAAAVHRRQRHTRSVAH